MLLLQQSWVVNKKKIVERLFPRDLSCGYTGHSIAKYVFYLVTAVTIIRSLIHMLTADGGAQSIATIPLNSYGEAAAAAVIHVFALWRSFTASYGVYICNGSLAVSGPHSTNVPNSNR